MKAFRTRGAGAGPFPLLTALHFVLAGVLGAAPRFVMEIRDLDGDIAIAGESDAAGHLDAIEVLSFGKSYRAPDGFPALETTAIDCRIAVDKSLPKLAAAATTRGGSIAQVDLFYLGDDSRPEGRRAAHMRLEHVQVVGLKVDVSAGADTASGPGILAQPTTVAHLSLNFSKVTWIYQQLDPSGSILADTRSALVAFASTKDPNFDDDLDGLNNALDDDDDGDMVPDAHEILTGTHALRDDGDEDLDHDHQTNRQEWLAGTRADDRTSFFAIRSLTVEQSPEGPSATVSFPLIEDRHYRLLGTPNPDHPRGEWLELDEFDTPMSSTETLAEVSLSPEIVPQLDRMFFVVEVSRRVL